MKISISKCIKRDGKMVMFDKTRITSAVVKAFADASEGNRVIAQKITESVIEKLAQQYGEDVPDVEGIQDVVEETLMSYGFNKTAKAYILYREQHARARDEEFVV